MSDEKRIERIEDALNAEVKESASFRGELRQFMSNTDSFIKAVSTKAGDAQAAVQAHEKDPNAHGAGIKRELDGKMVGWATFAVTALASFGGVIGALAHKVFSGEAPRPH